jgi:protein tyrosine/serine phosphatase
LRKRQAFAWRVAIKGQESKIPIICNMCMYGADGEWNTSINHHINSRSGCPSCSGNLSWTLDKFLRIAQIINLDNYNYSLVTEDHIKGRDSKVPLICNICQYGMDGN